MSTEPLVASKSRATRLTKVVFPDPVLPITAVVSPGSERKVMSSRTGDSAPGYAKLTPRNSRVPGVGITVTGSAGGRTEGSVWSTSWMRSALTAARGAITPTKVAIITEKRIRVK